MKPPPLFPQMLALLEKFMKKEWGANGREEKNRALRAPQKFAPLLTMPEYAPFLATHNSC